MPYIRIDPEFRLEHNGVEVFCLHDDDGSPCRYWFTTNPDNADDFHGHLRRGQFDARQMAGRWPGCPNVAEWDEFWKARFKTEDEAVDALIVKGIESGTIKPEVS